MFEIGFSEIILLVVVTLLVLGPERLPGAVRSAARWTAQIRRMLASARTEIERELNTDEIKREIHNAQIMHALKQEGQDVKQALSHLPYDVSDSIKTEHDKPEPPHA